MKRAKVKAQILPASPSGQVFFSSGCALLDCVLGGGWALGKVSNIVGDKSTGKTLLAIEASANFVTTFKDGEVEYVEAESAFDPAYARTLGLPDERLTLTQDVRTVEEMWRRIEARCERTDGTPQLMIIDSLDALSDEAEMEREAGAGSYGMEKAKQLSIGFRKHIDQMSAANLHVMFISQVRDNITAIAWAKKVKRSGGHALDFYASQVLWLYEKGKIKRTVGGLERPIGIEVTAKCEKNKVGYPFRECELSVLYGFGIDDVLAAFNWCKSAAPERIGDLIDGATKENYKRHLTKVKRADVGPWITALWNEIDLQFQPTTRKYP
jgi:recombination protein RecA